MLPIRRSDGKWVISPKSPAIALSTVAVARHIDEEATLSEFNIERVDTVVIGGGPGAIVVAAGVDSDV